MYSLFQRSQFGTYQHRSILAHVCVESHNEQVCFREYGGLVVPAPRLAVYLPPAPETTMEKRLRNSTRFSNSLSAFVMLNLNSLSPDLKCRLNCNRAPVRWQLDSFSLVSLELRLRALTRMLTPSLATRIILIMNANRVN